MSPLMFEHVAMGSNHRQTAGLFDRILLSNDKLAV